MKRALFSLVLLLCFGTLVSAEGGTPVFASEVLSDICSVGSLVIVNKKPGTPEYLPQESSFTNFFELQKPASVTVSFESLYFIPIENLENELSFKESLSSLIWKTILDVESLVGIEYYSETKKAMRILYTESRIIDESLEIKSSPENYLFAKHQAGQVIQKDSSFGKNTYKYEWIMTGELWAFSSVNETKLRYGMVTAAEKGGLTNIAGIFPLDDGLLLYVFTAIDTPAALPGFMTKRIQLSLSNRTQAMKNWLADSLEMVIAKKN